MAREVKHLEGDKFTTMYELAREIRALLRSTDLKLVVKVSPANREKLLAEFADESLMSRVVISK